MDFKARFENSINTLKKLGLQCEVLVNKDGVFITSTCSMSKKHLRKTGLLTEVKSGKGSFFFHLLDKNANIQDYKKQLLAA